MAALEKQDTKDETYLQAPPSKVRFHITQRHVAAWTAISSVIWLLIFSGHMFEKYWLSASTPNTSPTHGIAQTFSWDTVATKPYLDYTPCLDG